MSLRIRVAVLLLLSLSWSCSSSDQKTSGQNAELQAPTSRVEKDEARAPDDKAVGGDGVAAADSVAPVKIDPARVIIYTANLSLFVDSFAQAEQALPALLDRFGAYLSESDVSRYDGARRLGHWTVRVPVEHYRSLLNALEGLGSVEASSSKAEDVTAEYVDLEARQKNKLEVEKRLAAILQQQTGHLAEVLEVEREIARVREEIERVEGRMRYMKNLANLSTVILTVTERHGYEALPEEPTLAERIKWAWRESTRALLGTTKTFIVLVVRIVPWLPVFALVMGLLVGLRRWRRRRRP